MRKLNLGSGGRNYTGFESLDKDPAAKPQHLCDIEEKFPFRDNSFDEIRAWNILEHIHNENKIAVMNEIYRILKPGGILDIDIPIKYEQAVMDPTHFSFWARESFFYFEEGRNFREGFVRRSRIPMPRFKVVSEETKGKGNWRLLIKLEAVK